MAAVSPLRRMTGCCSSISTSMPGVTAMRRQEVASPGGPSTAASHPSSARPTSIEILPKQIDLDLPGRAQRVIVLAHYPDGVVRDVTREAAFARELEPLPAGVRLGAGRGPLDCVLLFAPDAATLTGGFPRWAARLTSAGMLWVAWPKKAAKIATDLDENVVRRIGLAAGLVDVKVCAVTEVWSGLKFVRRLRDR